MTGIESLYNRKNGKVLIEIKLSSIMQIFNSLDPSPFHEKELDHDAEHYIVDTVDDFPKKTQFAIVVYLPADLADSPGGRAIPAAIRNHFDYLTLVTERTFRQRARYGRFSLVVALVFLSACLFISSMIRQAGDGLLTTFISEAFTIAGWVALWTPVTVFLYDLYPIVQTRNLYKRISAMEIGIVPVRGSEPVKDP